MKMYYLFPLETEDTKGYQVVFTYFLVQLQIAIFYRNEIFSELFYLPTLKGKILFEQIMSN